MPENKRLLYIAILCGLCAIVFSQLYLKSKEKQIEEGMTKVKILVARKDIPAKTLLMDKMFVVREVPEKYVEPRAIHIKQADETLEEGEGEMVVRRIGKYAASGFVNMVPIFKGQQIVQSALLPPSMETGLSVKVPAGARAIVVPIANIDIRDLIKPGDLVDVLCTFDAATKVGRKTKVTSTILQAVRVLSVGESMGFVKPTVGKKKSKGGFMSTKKTSASLNISIAVRPDEAQIVALAKEQGELDVVIRGRSDTEMTLIGPIDASLFLRAK